MATERLDIAISLLRTLSCRERLLLSDLYTGLETSKGLFHLRKETIEVLIGRRLRRDPVPEEWERRSDDILRRLEHGGFTLLRYWDKDYPPQLREIYNPPFLLYMRGKMPAVDTPFAAVVGTRRPSETALQAAFKLGAELSLAGVPVVSGLAKGIDGAAHWGVIRTGGPTIAVEATGIDMVYPAVHRELASGILENGGALLSEYPPGTEVRTYRFPERNRLISGLSRAVVVVQAPEKSGALITADYALEQGRELLVHGSGLNGTAGTGCRKLRAEGAERIERAEDLVRDWPVRPRSAVQELRKEESIRDEGSAARFLEDEIEGRLLRFGAGRYRRVG